MSVTESREDGQVEKPPVILAVSVGEGEIDLPQLVETMMVDLEVSGCGYVTVRLATPADHARALGLDAATDKGITACEALEIAALCVRLVGKRPGYNLSDELAVMDAAAALVRESEEADE